ncbi:MAG: hypothetical protein RL313_829 [Actinomycetota bacterium]
MLGFTVIGSFWLEIALKVGVLRRIKRAIFSILPVSTLFILWDAYAVSQGHWFFDREQIVGIYGPFDIPLEEYLFFIVVDRFDLINYLGINRSNSAEALTFKD